MKAEIESIANEREAFSFAFGCLQTAAWQALAARSRHWTIAVKGMRSAPQQVGLSTAAVTVLLGCAFMVWASAPTAYACMNGLALAFAMATFWALPRQRLGREADLRSVTSLALGAALLIATALAREANGSGWLQLGSLHVQTASVLLPALLVVSATGVRGPTLMSSLGILMALGALAFQTNPVMPAIVAIVIGRRALIERSGVYAGLALAALLTAAALWREWQAPTSASFIDQVPNLGFQRHPGAGVALGIGLASLLLPALLHPRAREHGLVWGTLIAASLPGWLPTPLLGFGGSAILGYVLSLVALPGPACVGAARPKHRREGVGDSHASSPLSHSGVA